MVLFPIQSTIEVPYLREVCLLRWWKEKSMADHFPGHIRNTNAISTMISPV